MLENKYHRWYRDIVAKGGDVSDYVEKHHILPKALGGSNKKINFISVTPENHFLLHWLLTKFTEGRDRYLMLHAFASMTAHKRLRCFASWRYGAAKRANTEVQKKLLEDPEYFEKTLGQRWASPKAREIQSKTLVEFYKGNEEACLARSERGKKRYQDLEARKKTGDSVRKFYEGNIEAHEDQSARMMKRWENLEARIVQREIQIRRYEDLEARRETGDLVVKYYEEHPEAREARGKETLKMYEEHPEAREARRAETKKRYEDPKEREKTSLASKKAWARRKGLIS
jgi:hypothetical protein